MTEIYSYDYVLAGKYLNDFLDENYRTQINHKFLDTERVTCIFGVNDEGKNILLVKTWRVFGGNYIVELDDYYNYEEAISHILSVYSNLEVNAVSMEIMMEEVNIDSDIVYYIGFLVNHGDHYSRFIFYYDQVVELDGRNSF